MLTSAGPRLLPILIGAVITLGGCSKDMPSALGSEELTPAIGLVDLQPGDTLLLCTDGLTRHVPDDQIRELLGAAVNAEAACRLLVDAARAGGGSDNITAVVARS